MVLPHQLIIYDCGYCLDGGTTTLLALDEVGQKHTITLTQHAFPQEKRSAPWIPGRLYVDEQLVPIRSILEASLLDLLKAAAIQCEPDEIVRSMIAQMIAFVESEQCLWFADRVEQAADNTAYTVWLTWDGRNQVLVRLGHVEGIGLRGARELLQQRHPVAEGVSALEVSDLAERYRILEIAIRVEPEFRWRLP